MTMNQIETIKFNACNNVLSDLSSSIRSKQSHQTPYYKKKENGFTKDSKYWEYIRTYPDEFITVLQECIDKKLLKKGEKYRFIDCGCGIPFIPNIFHEFCSKKHLHCDRADGIEIDKYICNHLFGFKSIDKVVTVAGCYPTVWINGVPTTDKSEDNICKMKEKYIKFIKHCLDNNNIDGVCSYKEFKKIDKQLKQDGMIEDLQ